MASPFTIAADFRPLTIMSEDDIQVVENRKPGYLQARNEAWWNVISARLRKRYDVAAMAAKPPEAVRLWWCDLMTKDAYKARGFDPSAKDDEEAILGAANDALAAIKEAADGEAGLYDLPLLSTSTESGVSKGGPLSYSEQSPYTWMGLQRTTGREEDGT